MSLLHLDRYAEAERLLPQVEARTDPRGIRFQPILGASTAIFKSQGIHEEPLKALALFCHAAKAEQAQLDWTRRLVKYLYLAS